MDKNKEQDLLQKYKRLLILKKVLEQSREKLRAYQKSELNGGDMNNIKARLQRIEQKIGITGEETFTEVEIIITPLKDFDSKKAICIATSRKDTEPFYTEILRTAETGEPVKREVYGITKTYSLITPGQAKELMQKWGLPEADILQEFS
jgi:uncharacterized protein YihD (DUF1040 family)